jgi:hypothetical protein
MWKSVMGSLLLVGLPESAWHRTSYSTVPGYLHDVERFSASLRGNRIFGLWSLTGALTSHIALHFLRFSAIFRGESQQIDREGKSVSIFSVTNPGFPETVTLRV